MAKKKQTGSASQEVVHYQFDSVHALNNHVERMVGIDRNYSDYLLNFATDKVYDITPTHEQMREKAVIGCRHLYEKYFQADSFNGLGNAERKLEYQLACTGLFVDVGAYLSGLPECFIDEVYVDDVSTRFVDIVVNVGAAHTISNTQIINKLKGVAAIVDSLEKSGVRTSLSISLKGISHNSCANYTFGVVIKKHEQPLNIEQLVYLLGSPVSMRYFCLMSAIQHMGDKAGNAHNCTDYDTIMIDNPNIIYIPSMYYDAQRGITDYTDLAKTYKLNLQKR